MAGTIAAEGADWREAKDLFLRGRYAEAAAIYKPQADRDEKAAIGMARCYSATGKREDAIKLLRGAIDRHPQEVRPRAELATLCFDSGDYGGARTLAAEALALDKRSLAARWVEAELLKYSGKLIEAQKRYQWFVDEYNRGAKIDTAEDLHFVGRAAGELARWTRNPNEFRKLVNDFYPAIHRAERNDWRAHLETALLFAEKYNQPDALAELTAGLTINPNAAELHAARAELALQQFDLATAKSALDRALEINPQLLWAHQLRADSLLADVRPAEAIVVLEQGLQLHPRSEATLGRLAAAYAAVDGFRDGEPAPRMAGVTDKVAAANPHCGEFYLALAESCDRMRRFPLAARYYREAQRAMPQLIGTRGKLGLALMRLGEEAEAATILEEAFAIDPFNVRVKNTLEVLEVLQGYAVIETEHFVLKFDRGHDELLARYASRYLEEEVFPQLVREFGYVPPGKTLIEIFSRSRNTSGHGWFSARMVGMPFIGTVGACAGKMIALASPSELPQKYNWAHVLRHEYVHVINLQQTDFHVPHWLTEGLAVHSENQPRPGKWNLLLARRAAEEKLFNLDTITLGFIRPHSGDDWTLAYCQAELYVDYVLATYGDYAPRRMLAAYAEHVSTPQVLERCFNVTQSDFESGYRGFLDKTIASEAPAPSKETKSFAQLQRAAEENHQDATAAAELAQAHLDRDSKPAARRWALDAQKLDPQQPLAAYVLARLQVSIGDLPGAIEILESSLTDKVQQDHLALLAALKLQNGDLAEAEKLHLLGAKHFPGAERWPKGLARIYLQQNEPKKLQPVLVRLAELDSDSAAIRQKLAQLALDAKDSKSATKWATEALHLDVQDADTHALLAAAAVGNDDFVTAADEYATAIRLDGQRPAWRFAWVQSLLKLGKRDDARAALKELRELDADYPGLSDLQKTIGP